MTDRELDEKVAKMLGWSHDDGAQGFLWFAPDCGRPHLDPPPFSSSPQLDGMIVSWASNQGDIFWQLFIAQLPPRTESFLLNYRAGMIARAALAANERLLCQEQRTDQ